MPFYNLKITYTQKSYDKPFGNFKLGSSKFII